MIEVYAYRAASGDVPLVVWLRKFPTQVQEKALERVARLRQFGHAVLENRTVAAHLEDRIYELRFRHFKVQHRLLFFFDGQGRAVISHGCTKERVVDPADIALTKRHRQDYARDRVTHTATWP